MAGSRRGRSHPRRLPGCLPRRPRLCDLPQGSLGRRSRPARSALQAGAPIQHPRPAKHGWLTGGCQLALGRERRPRMAAWKLAESTLDADQLGYVEVDNETSEPWLVLQEIAKAHGRVTSMRFYPVTNRRLRRAAPVLSRVFGAERSARCGPLVTTARSAREVGASLQPQFRRLSYLKSPDRRETAGNQGSFHGDDGIGVSGWSRNGAAIGDLRPGLETPGVWCDQIPWADRILRLHSEPQGKPPSPVGPHQPRRERARRALEVADGPCSVVRR